MIVSPYFAISENFLPHHVCDDIIKVAYSQKQQEAEIQSGTDKKVRESRLVWLRDAWIYDWIAPVMRDLNCQLNWNFQLTQPEDIQFTIYKKGHFYGWHQDLFEFEKNKLMNFQRKISAVVPLVDSENYKGGDLQFYNSNIHPNKKDDRIVTDELSRKKGSLVIFPSFIWHQVTPVLEGERLSIVIWFQGETGS
jgi:PKHD-type hydroxylase